MQVVLESPSALEREVTITVPNADVETEFEEKLKATSKQVRIDGFRPGKVPAKVVRQRYGKAIRQEIASDLMEKALGQALSDHDLKPIGQPTIGNVKFEEGQDFSFQATFEVFPEIDPILVNGEEIMQTQCKIGAADIKEMIVTLREQRKAWKESARAQAKAGDRITIDFDGFINGEAFDGGQGVDHLLVIGSGSMIPGFEDGIIGMKKGECREIEVIFPDDYHVEALKNQKATFKINLTKVERGNLPAVDENFIKSFGVETGDEKDFKAELKQQMERELSLTLKNTNKIKVFDKLLEINSEIPVPLTAVNAEIQTLKTQAVERFSGGQQFDTDQLPKELFTEQAERRVRLGILLGATVKKLKIGADAEIISALIDEMASAYDDPEQVRNHYYANEESLKQVEALAIEEQVATRLLESASASAIVMSYAEVMQKRQ